MARKTDAVVTGANGIACIAVADPLGALFDLPPGFLRAVGAFLTVFAVAVWLVAQRPRPWAAGVLAANVPWVVASLALVLFDLYEPSTVGVIWTVLQTTVAALVVVLQAIGLRHPGA